MNRWMPAVLAALAAVLSVLAGSAHGPGEWALLTATALAAGVAVAPSKKIVSDARGVLRISSQLSGSAVSDSNRLPDKLSYFASPK